MRRSNNNNEPGMKRLTERKRETERRREVPSCLIHVIHYIK